MDGNGFVLALAGLVCAGILGHGYAKSDYEPKLLNAQIQVSNLRREVESLKTEKDRAEARLQGALMSK